MNLLNNKLTISIIFIWGITAQEKIEDIFSDPLLKTENLGNYK